MAAESDRFSRTMIDTLAKRAANTCSNPDCQAITSGPSSEDYRAITVGEAAHIYGAHPGSARHDDKMISEERSSITNAIWLCRNCHRIIDLDPNEYPAALQFEWRREHEIFVAERIGKASDRMRQKIITEELDRFKNASYLARQIVIDKPYAWEYRLTAELLRTLLRSVMSRASQLERGLYTKSLERVSIDTAPGWFGDRFREIADITPAIMTIVTREFAEAWGAPGSPGSSEAILGTCMLFEEACQQLLAWEERIRFSSVPQEFEELRDIMIGIGLRALNQINHIPTELARIFSKEKTTGQHEISVIIDLPENWEERVGRIFQKMRENHE